MQILRNTPGTLELNVYEAGDLTDLDANPTVAVTDANGAVVASGVVDHPGIGIYRSILPGQTNLKTLTAVWSGLLDTEAVSFTQQYEIVGNILFTEAEARGARFTGQQAPLASETDYDDDAIAAMRELVASQFEEKTSHSWVRRYCRMEITGTSSRQLSLYRGEPRDVNGNESGGAGRLYNVAKLISVTVDGVAVADLTTIQLAGRSLIRDAIWPWSSTPFNIVVEYEYGDDPVDLEARENGLRMVVANLVPSDVPAYTQNFTSEEGTVTYPPGGLVWPAKTREWLDRYPRRRIPVAI